MIVQTSTRAAFHADMCQPSVDQSGLACLADLFMIGFESTYLRETGQRPERSLGVAFQRLGGVAYRSELSFRIQLTAQLSLSGTKRRAQNISRRNCWLMLFSIACVKRLERHGGGLLSTSSFLGASKNMCEMRVGLILAMRRTYMKPL